MSDIKKKIAKNAIYNAIYSVLDIAFPLITVPYLSRILLADGLGKVNYAKNITAWFLVVASLGIPRYGVREIAKVKKDGKDLDKTFSELFLINLFSTCICLSIYIMVINIIPFLRERVYLLLITGVRLALNIFNVDWFYRGMEQYRYITKRSFVIKFLSFITMFIFVKKYDDYYKYAIIQSIAIAGNNIFNFVHIRKYCSLSFNNLRCRRHLKSIFILLSTQLTINIYALLDTTMLGMWCSDAVVGYYTNCNKVIGTITSLTASLSAVLLPQLVICYKNGDYSGLRNIAQKTLSIIITVCVPMVTGLILLSEELVILYFGSDFVPCIKTMMLFAPFILITTVGNLYGPQLLMTFNQEKKSLICVTLGAMINIILNSMLMKRYMQDGATIASVVTELIVMGMEIYFVNRELKIFLNRKTVQSTLVSSLVMTPIVLFAKWIIDDMLLRMICSVLLGGGVYLIMCFLTENEAMFLVLRTIRGKNCKVRLKGFKRNMLDNTKG